MIDNAYRCTKHAVVYAVCTHSPTHCVLDLLARDRVKWCVTSTATDAHLRNVIRTRALESSAACPHSCRLCGVRQTFARRGGGGYASCSGVPVSVATYCMYSVRMRCTVSYARYQKRTADHPYPPPAAQRGALVLVRRCALRGSIHQGSCIQGRHTQSMGYVHAYLPVRPVIPLSWMSLIVILSRGP